MSVYESLIKELGAKMGLNLRPDGNQSCCLVLGNTQVQVDLDMNAEDILLGSILGTLMPGPYRDQLFRQALKVNGLTTTSRGVFAFTQKSDSLVLFQFLKMADLDGEKLLSFLELFSDHATIWQEALSRGEVPQLEEDMTRGGRMFGL